MTGTVVFSSGFGSSEVISKVEVFLVLTGVVGSSTDGNGGSGGKGGGV
jgi:hypothetical protein